MHTNTKSCASQICSSPSRYINTITDLLLSTHIYLFLLLISTASSNSVLHFQRTHHILFRNTTLVNLLQHSSSPTMFTKPLTLVPLSTHNPQFTRNPIGFSPKPLRYTPLKRFSVNEDSTIVAGLDEAEKELRESSTMPGRFRDHIKEASDPPLKWQWFLAMAFLVYAWRALLFELSNWKNAAFGIVRFIGYVFKYVFALLYRFIGNPITCTIRSIEDLIYGIQAFYSWIITSAPVPDLTIVIFFASVVLAIAETIVPNCISNPSAFFLPSASSP